MTAPRNQKLSAPGEAVGATAAEPQGDWGLLESDRGVVETEPDRSGPNPRDALAEKDLVLHQIRLESVVLAREVGAMDHRPEGAASTWKTS